MNRKRERRKVVKRSTEWVSGSSISSEVEAEADGESGCETGRRVGIRQRTTVDRSSNGKEDLLESPNSLFLRNT